MNFFFDNTLSPRFAKALNELSKNHNITYLRKKYRGNTPDLKWLKELGKQEKDWIIISGDLGIIRNLHEQEALIRSGCTYFVFERPFGEKDYWTQIKRLMNILPEIIKTAKKNRKN